MGTQIDSRAVVSPKAGLGNDVVVGPFTVIEDDTVIGDGTEIGSSVLIASGARIGRNCKIHHCAVISGLPQDLKFKDAKTTLEIGDNTIVREFCSLHRGTEATKRTIVGSDCFLMAYVHVAHDCRVGNNVILANSVNMGGHVAIDDYTIVGGIVAIHQFCKIGRNVIVGGGFRVFKDVPPYIRAGKEPLAYNGLNIIGLRRRGFSPEAIASIDKAYHLLYQSGLNVTQAVERIKAEMQITPEVQNILDFIAKSERGIIRGGSRSS
jgi:UDP-N-acetylglucosamine acyltransferase